MNATALGPRTFGYVHDLLEAAGNDPVISKSRVALRLLINLTHKAKRTGRCYRSIHRMAEELGHDRNTIRRSLRRLVEGGWLTMVMRPGRKVYDFIFPIEPEARAAAVVGPVAGTSEADRPDPSAPAIAAADFGGRRRPSTSGGAGARPTSGGAGARPLRGAPAPPKPIEPQIQPLQPHAGDGEPSSDGGRGAGAAPIRPGPAGGCRDWIGYALAVHDSWSGPDQTRQAVSEAAGATFGRLGFESPGGIAGPVWEAVRGSQADRSALLEAAANADHLLRVGKPASEAKVRFLAILKGTAKPLYDDPIPGSEHAEAARRPEPGAGRRRRETGDDRGGLAELAGMLADRPAGVMGFAVGRAEGPPPARPGAWVPLPESELKRVSRGAWDRVRSGLATEGGAKPWSGAASPSRSGPGMTWRSGAGPG